MLDKNKTYLILNKNSSPIVVDTRYDGYVIPAGSEEEPSSLPFSVDEISQINSKSPVFKVGLLWFEPEFEKELYEEVCHIRDWEKILSDEEIEDSIINPTVEKLNKILDIQNPMYFERCYGIYMGLRNSNHAIQGNVISVMNMRYKEMRHKKFQTGITLTKTMISETTDKEELNEVKEQLSKAQEERDNALKKSEENSREIAELKAMISQLMNGKNVTETTVDENKPKKGRPAKAKTE